MRLRLLSVSVLAAMAAVPAALAGEGMAFLPDDLVAEDLAAGRLVQVLDDWTPPFPGLSLYYPSRRHVPAKLRALIDLLRERQG